MVKFSNKMTSKKQYYSVHSSNIQPGKRHSIPSKIWKPVADDVPQIKKTGALKGSKYIGVYFVSDKNMFYFKLSKYGKVYNSKNFDNELDAAYAYDKYIINHDLKRKLNFRQIKHNKGIKYDYTKRTKIPDFTKNRIYSQQGEKCSICKNYLGEFRVMDHIKPLYLNGLDNITNYQALCGTCNSWKTYSFDKIIKEYLEKNSNASIEMIKYLQTERYLKFNSPC